MRSAAMLIIIMAMVGWALAGNASAYIIINAPMNDTNSAGWTLGGNPTSALLTGNGAIDPVGNGWLRLTNNTGNQTGYAYNNTNFDLSSGLLIEFDYSTWGGTGADGYSVYLFDAGVSPFNIGAFGGSLGYAQKGASTGGTCTANGTNVPGISGGYIGIGVDEFGNFSDCAEGRYLPANDNTTAPNTVTIRGAVAGFGNGAIGSTQGLTSYPWIATSATAPSSLWYNGTPRPSQTSTDYRHVRIQISPAPNPVANVWIAFGYNSPPVFTQMLTNVAIPPISPSQLLKIGYAASTGGSTNYHEIRNLLVSNQYTMTAVDLQVTKTFTDVTSGSTTTASIGDTVRYTVIASNSGPNNVTATGVGIQDAVPATITGISVTCTASGGATCLSSSVSGTNFFNATASLPRYGYVTYTITGTLGAGASSLLSNTASLVIPGSVTDYNPNNNSATVNIPVNSNLSTSTKTWTDPNGGDQNAGDVIPYTITLIETGGAAASGVTVTDTFPATLTGLFVVSCPTGTCNIVGQVLTITNASVPANGSVSFVISTTIAGGTPAGTLINNTATITNPAGPGATPAAPTITVSASQIAASGNKQLYLYDNTSSPQYKLSRIPMAVNAGSFVAIPRGNNVQTWTLNPALAADVTINSGNIPVNLYLATNSSRSYTPRIDLLCGATVVATENTQAATLTGTVTLFTFTLPRATSYACASGSSWALRVTNTMGAGGGARDIRVYPAPAAGQFSNVTLSSQNVINVTSVTAYNQTYPGTGTLASWTTTTIYLRAVVSDPFGSYDIDANNNATTQPTIVIKDPGGAPVLTTAMPRAAADANNPTSSTRTFEYAYMPAGPVPSGFWTVSVTAPEGTETSPVTDTGVGTFKIMPNLTMTKSVSMVSDPSGGANPKAIPGAVILYTIQVTNSSYGTVDNDTTMITDPVPTNTGFCVSALCANPPVGFSCSTTPACGLSYAYGSNVSYACSGGACPSSDANGYSTNVTSVMINPAGIFSGATGTPYPNFAITLKAQIK